MNNTSSEIAEIIRAGYAITSRASGIASRIDCQDWKERMAKEHSPWDPINEGTEWVTCLGNYAADHYRRVYSKDKIIIPKAWVKYIPRSGDSATGFCHKAYNKSNDKAQKEILIDMLKAPYGT